ncbi:hypothetical protein [Brevundimonas sp.]|jgi:hypothetical protein|uniref:hypothetical protein n=1 Tax=Brevundimonas sp. TaxID=1871086 RepID=UPI002E104503|nr:hypothetical protein [Brevundimonas sp.]
MSVEQTRSELRSLVVELAGLDDDDLRLIADELEPTARTRLFALINEFRQGDFSKRGAKSEPPPPQPILSPWLIEHLEGTGDRHMTLRGVRELRKVAADIGWSQVSGASVRPTGRFRL